MAHMTRGFAALVSAILLCASGASASERAGVGPLRLGMDYDAVRVATPGATWKAMAFRGIELDAVFTLGGVPFGAQVTDGPWDRYRILAFHVAPLVDVAACRSDFETVAGALQQSVGTLRAPPSFGDDEVNAGTDQQAIALGSGSALLLRHAVAGKPEAEWPIELSASWKEGATTMNVTAQTQAAADNKPAQCVIRIALSEYVKRPRKGDVSFDDLVFSAVPSIGRLHHSLDSVALPGSPVDLSFDCVVDDLDGHLGACTPVSREAGEALIAAGLQRLSDYRVADKTRSGKWTPGEHTIAKVHIAASDRRDELVVDVSKQGQLVFAAQPRTEEMVRFFPRAAMADGVGSELSVGCVVQTDYSVVCPQIAVSAGVHAQAFRKAAAEIVTLYRAQPTLRDGSSSVGAGFRATISLLP